MREWRRSADFELLLDHIDYLFEMYHEFPTSVWEVFVRLHHSRQTSVRMAMATRGVPRIYNEVNPYLAEKLGACLLEDRSAAVAKAMADSYSRREAA